MIKVVAKNAKGLAATLFRCNKGCRNCNVIAFATIKVVAKNNIFLQLLKSLLKPLATAVHATTEVVAKNIFSNEIWILATPFFVAKSNFIIVL